MRIRTVKPEFWSHPVMTRQDDATKLLALGLLNYSDDEGFFYAESQLVRASLRPFDDDSTIVRRSLDQLQKIGYIEVREHQTHGLVGMVLSFNSHQRVDRPKPSVIKDLYNSTIDRRLIDDESRKNVAVSGNREQGTGKGMEYRETGVSLSLSGMKEAENDFAEIVKPKKEKKPQPTQAELLEAIKTNPAYAHIDVNRELAKMDAWLLVNPGRQKTPRFVTNWLNKIQAPIGPQESAHSKKSQFGF